MAKVILEPIGEELDCGSDETILEAAFRQGFSLVHGCREGQCSACKAYLLAGEVSLGPYSTFALSDTEQDQGYTLLCRAMPDDDEVTVELLHFDPDNYRSEHPLRNGRATVSVVEQLTHDIARVVLKVEDPSDFDYAPGHYIDLCVPGTEVRRSFSMANLPGDGSLELIIKCYPGGEISGRLQDGRLGVGAELEFVGPYGSFRLRDNERPIMMVAGGSGMAPQLALLRELASQGSARPIRFFYGARRRRDLFALEQIESLAAELGDFQFLPVLSEPGDEDWEGERGLVHEAVDRALRDGTTGPDPEVYLCGPPVMVEAATELLLEVHGLDDDQIHFDKFTTSAAGGQEART